jgi:hypothetical protein
MGWNDHMHDEEMECQDCGQIDTWTIWDDVAKVRYAGGIGKKLGLDATKADCCPHCGSTNGKPANTEADDDYGWRD